jgi:glycosyltransferase involved in cell wall biosynthesis
LAEKIQILLNNPERRRQFGQIGRAKVEAKYAWPKVVERLEQVYYSIMPNLLRGGGV